jgi:hypothetical protein
MNIIGDLIKSLLNEEGTQDLQIPPSNKVIMLNRMSYGCTKEMM